MVMLTKCKNQQMPKQVATASMKGTRNRGRYVKDGEMRLKMIQI
jgi:hypothetical protein